MGGVINTVSRLSDSTRLPIDEPMRVRKPRPPTNPRRNAEKGVEEIMASVAVTEPSLSPVSEALVPACMFAPERGCGDDPAGSEHCDDGEALNGKLGDHVDFTCKSTLLGVLTHGELDNGRGFARQKLFRHKHEMESGRTSSVGNDILGFDQRGAVVNLPDGHGGSLDWTKICERSAKVITFIDLAGHEKYLKTTVFGMTGHLPDFCMLMVGSNAGIVGMTKEHLGLALALNVPVFVVVTKIDMCPANILQGCRKIPVLVQNSDDVIVTASNFSSERMCPIFQISNVTGENMDLLKMFLNLLSSRTSFSDEEPAEFQIDDTYSVPV
ncbi:UNVERIFIED_CONTAM: hypothetical protein FKN15_031276 [Acipenser sinensis]